MSSATLTITRDVETLRASVAAAERALADLEYSDDHAHVSGAWDRANALVNRLHRELAEAETREAMRDPAYWRDRDRAAVKRVQAGLSGIVCGPLDERDAELTRIATHARDAIAG